MGGGAFKACETTRIGLGQVGLADVFAGAAGFARLGFGVGVPQGRVRPQTGDHMDGCLLQSGHELVLGKEGINGQVAGDQAQLVGLPAQELGVETEQGLPLGQPGLGGLVVEGGTVGRIQHGHASHLQATPDCLGAARPEVADAGCVFARLGQKAGVEGQHAVRSGVLADQQAVECGKVKPLGEVGPVAERIEKTLPDQIGKAIPTPQAQPLPQQPDQRAGLDFADFGFACLGHLLQYLLGECFDGNGRGIHRGKT